MVILKLQTKH